ncbi:hypothetical protein A671_00275 [Salmonella enterica subsp. enterica serovar Dublin str. DG22]|nr:hypothetical protein A671_00275 [Salmonella enterica subsp. enterica serovar Dublin str. DG22]EPJ12210.1 hypothetical protein A680_00664 [Salmonella enterica subsp. enterica serovar Enteritidis str. 2010K-0286]
MKPDIVPTVARRRRNCLIRPIFCECSQKGESCHESYYQNR